MSMSLIEGKGVVLAVAFAAGAAATLLAWLVGGALSGVPPEDRAHKDAPPLGMRLVWWPLHCLSYFVGPLLGEKRRASIQDGLRSAGLEYTVTPDQLVSARLLAAFVLGLLCGWGVNSFDNVEAGAGVGPALYLQLIGAGAMLGFYYPSFWLRDLVKARRAELLKTLPFYLDIITLCVEAGLNLQGAFKQAVEKGPKGLLQAELRRVLRDIRAGKARAEAMRAMAERLSEKNVTHFISAVIQAERMGMNLGPVLRAQADQRRSERFARAEKLAMEAPVKLLFPLIAFIFPCTFIVLFFPIVMKFLHPGI